MSLQNDRLLRHGVAPQFGEDMVGGALTPPLQDDRPDGRSSPLRRLSSGNSLLPDASVPPGDTIHAALLRLCQDFPVVQSFQRINMGFYRVDGAGACELSLARNSDKLFCKLDNWNRGVRGELVKFLREMSSTGGDAPKVTAELSTGGKSATQPEARLGQRLAKAGSFKPPERMPKAGMAEAGAPNGSVGATTPAQRRAAAAAVGGGVRKTMSTPASRAGTKAGPGAAAQRRPGNSDLMTPRSFMARYREGALFVSAREPLFGDPMVLLKAGDVRLEAQTSDGANDPRVLARLLCSGRTAEVRAACIAPLEIRPFTSSTASLAAFEELFLVGRPDEMNEPRHRAVFGRVELGELTTQKLAAVINECWPRDAAAPLHGLAWALRPFFIDWLKRRHRLYHFTQLAVGLPAESLRRCNNYGEMAQLGGGGGEFPSGGPQHLDLESLLLDVTERDLFIAMLLTTPPDQRSRLYDLARTAGMSLPLAFPGLRCPCPPADEPDSPADSEGGAQVVDRGVNVHWEAFESLLARPSDRPLFVSVGSHGCSHGGKSTLLKELLGLEVAAIQGSSVQYTVAATAARRVGAAPAASPTPQCPSPVHTPGADLVPAEEPFSWAVDVHGCALGDPSFMSMVATFTATASLVLLHVSPDDFVIQYEEPPPPPIKRAPDPSRPSIRRTNTVGGSPGGSAALPPTTPTERADAGPPKINIKPDLLALLRLCADARLPGVGPIHTRILVLFRDHEPARQPSQLVSTAQMLVESLLGASFAGFVEVERLVGVTGGHRQRALAPVRSKFSREMQVLAEAGSHDMGAAGSPSPKLPSVDTLKRIFGHFYDRMTLAGERPVLASADFAAAGRTQDAIFGLLDEAEANAGGRLSAVLFPVSEAATQFARLKAQEKRLFEEDDGNPNDAKVAALAARIRALEMNRKAMLAEPLSQLVHYFVETVLSETGVRYAKVMEFGQCLAAWRQPRMTPVVERRRQLLDSRLQVSQDRRLNDEARQAQLDELSAKLADAELLLEQLNVTVDGFWGELAAVSDLTAEMLGLGIRPPPHVPEAGQLKRQFGDWAYHLNQPVQLLHGSPLQSAGQFLVDVLRDLGAQEAKDLFVISVIGIQSSAKSTLLNYLFGCGFATSAGRCTRGLYCSLMEAQGRTLLLLDTEGLMSLEAEGGDIFDAQLALMAMACSHLVLINHKGELSRQLQDLLEVCLFAMQHLRVTKLQPKLLFVLRDQHDRSNGVHTDALRLMRKHLSEASCHLNLRLDDLIALDAGSIFLLPSAFASDLDPHVGREKRWSTGLFAAEAIRLRQKIFQYAATPSSTDGEGAAPEFSTLPDWCIHAMSVWRVLDRYGPNLLHYKTIQEIEVQRELEDLVKQISATLVNGVGGLAEQTKELLADCSRRLSEEVSTQVDVEFQSSLQALLDRCGKKAQADLEQALQARKSKFPEHKKEEAKKKLQTPVEYQGELTRYTWTLCLTEAVDRDQLRALKVHFKKTIEDLWQSEASRSLAEEQARKIFAVEWETFEEKCRARFGTTTRHRKQLAEEVCLVFNHALRQHRHSDQGLHIVEMVPATALLNEEPISAWANGRLAAQFLEVRHLQRLAEFCAGQQNGADPRRHGHHAQYSGSAAARTALEQLEAFVVPELRRRLAAVLSLEIAEGSTQVPAEDVVLDAMKRLNAAVQAEETNFLSKLGVRFQGGCVAFVNAAHLCLRHSVLSSLVKAETQRQEHQWATLQSHKLSTEEEFITMVQKQTSDAGRAKVLADLFFDALAREWLDETLVAVAADIRAQCLVDMPDASGAAERAYQQAFVERNWDEVLEYTLDVNAYLHKMFSKLFEDRKASITRSQGPMLARQMGVLFDSLTSATQRWGNRASGRRAKLSSLQVMLQGLAAESRAAHHQAAGADSQAPPWPLLSERFPVVADFEVEDPARFASDFSLQVAARLGESKVEGLVSSRLEAALQKQQAQVWALIKGCSAMCPCCGSKCDRTDSHTTHSCSHHLLPAFNGWRVAGTCEAALDACKSCKNHEAPKRSDYSDHLFPNLQEYLKAEHPEWLPFPKEDRELLADSVLKAAWVNCRIPLLHRYDMVDSTPAEWLTAYEEQHRRLPVDAIDRAEARLAEYGYELQDGGQR
eukprot:TRINITY_DN21966_c0_g1_i6.p1 TRINITY_DN21966_c0_g1~~TRINITY_DN21966_c0_g1_i6.p1  ORF type:complete len:2120 (-),score=532.50 TRINITY_DN21966_c0_g1_i6:240-6599(-)